MVCKFLCVLFLFFKLTAAEKFDPFKSTKYLNSSFEKDEDEALSIRELGWHRLTKRSIGDHFDDSQCVESFETSEKTIIRTIESKANGAIFLNNTEVDSYEMCLRFCCETPQCTVAIWDQQNSGCYLFDCGPSTPEEFKCRFTGNEAFTSGALLINRQAFEVSRWDHKSKHENMLQDLIGDGRLRGGGDSFTQGASLSQAPVCGQYEFTCQSGECIAVYDVCNSIAQCSDGSDEDLAICPPTTSKPARAPITRATPAPTPPTTFARPPSIEQWGREGERYSPGSVVQNLQPQQSQQTYFQHRNPAIQIPPFDPQSLQGPRYNLDYNNYRFPQPYQQAPGYYPAPMNGYGQDNGYMMPPVPQQNPMVDNRYPVQNFPNGPQQQFIPNQVNGPVYNNNNQPPQSTTSNPTTSKPSTKKTTSITSTTPATTTENQEEILKNQILKNLPDSELVMETPSAAIFTLVVGSLISGVLLFILLCRCRALRKNRTRKRNLAADADEDYLVNGLYL